LRVAQLAHILANVAKPVPVFCNGQREQIYEIGSKSDQTLESNVTESIRKERQTKY
jgi:hypothetical protein